MIVLKKRPAERAVDRRFNLFGHVQNHFVVCVHDEPQKDRIKTVESNELS
jgi:hypothetical protein